MPDEFVQVKGGIIHYDITGEGTPIVLIHAGYLDCRMWEKEIQYLSRSYRVITYDVRGYGKSSVPDSEYSDVEDLSGLLDFLMIKKAILIGVSNGGRIAFDFATEHPERVSAMISVNSGIRGIETVGDESDLWNNLGEIEEQYLAFIKAGKKREAAALDVDYWSHMLKGDLREKVLDIAEENVPEPDKITDDYQRSPQPPAFKRLSRIAFPVLILSGEFDRKGMRQIAEKVHENLPSSKFRVIKNADHLPNLSSPDQFKNEMLEFLEEIEK